MLKYLLVLVCLCSTTLYAQPPVVIPEEKVVITFPKITTSVVTPVSTNGVALLQPGQVYVIQSTVKFFALTSPIGKATVTYDDGPLKFKGVFVDGSGEIETRVFPGPFVATLEVTKGASGRVELLCVPTTGITVESDIPRILIDIGVAPQPPPVPVPIPPIPEPLTTAQKITQALTGTTAKSDAVILVAAAEAVQASMSKYTNAAQLQQHWGQLLATNKWVKGSRPQITALIEAEIPPTAGAALPFTDADRTRISALFKAIEDGASEVLK